MYYFFGKSVSIIYGLFTNRRSTLCPPKDHVAGHFFDQSEVLDGELGRGAGEPFTDKTQTAHEVRFAGLVEGVVSEATADGLWFLKHSTMDRNEGVICFKGAATKACRKDVAAFLF